MFVSFRVSRNILVSCYFVTVREFLEISSYSVIILQNFNSYSEKYLFCPFRHIIFRDRTFENSHRPTCLIFDENEGSFLAREVILDFSSCDHLDVYRVTPNNTELADNMLVTKRPTITCKSQTDTITSKFTEATKSSWSFK